jgi:hypothetical protein
MYPSQAHGIEKENEFLLSAFLNYFAANARSEIKIGGMSF